MLIVASVIRHMRHNCLLDDQCAKPISCACTEFTQTITNSSARRFASAIVLPRAHVPPRKRHRTRRAQSSERTRRDRTVCRSNPVDIGRKGARISRPRSHVSRPRPGCLLQDGWLSTRREMQVCMMRLHKPTAQKRDAAVQDQARWWRETTARILAAPQLLPTTRSNL